MQPEPKFKISVSSSIASKTILYSSRMRTARLLPVSPSMHCTGRVPASGQGGVYPSMQWGRPPALNRILDTRFWKYYLAPTSLQAVIITQNQKPCICWTRQFHFRPQQSWGKVIFSQASVILLTGGVPAPWGCLVWSRGCLVEPPRDGHSCGRYASYWNAFLFKCQSLKSKSKTTQFHSNIIYWYALFDFLTKDI